jgi:hypothetical protein
LRVLLTVTAVLEAAMGLALLASPSVPVALLLGTPLDGAAAPTVARLAGAALLVLGLACWLARAGGPSRAGRGLIAAMLLYNVAAAALLLLARFGQGLSGFGLLPGVILHTALGAWCLAVLRSEDAGTTESTRP